MEAWEPARVLRRGGEVCGDLGAISWRDVFVSEVAVVAGVAARRPFVGTVVLFIVVAGVVVVGVIVLVVGAGRFPVDAALAPRAVVRSRTMVHLTVPLDGVAEVV